MNTIRGGRLIRGHAAPVVRGARPVIRAAPPAAPTTPVASSASPIGDKPLASFQDSTPADNSTGPPETPSGNLTAQGDKPDGKSKGG